MVHGHGRGLAVSRGCVTQCNETRMANDHDESSKAIH